ncbi:MAG: complex I subunit 5 family protein [Candidatus Wenzhouxiangella sp. M2_3B_020]
MTLSAHGSACLLAGLVLWPLIATVPVALASWRGRTAGGVLTALATGIALAAAGLLALSDGAVTARLPSLLGAIELRADPAGRAFALVAAFVWFCASVHAVGYLRDDPAAGRLRVAALVLLSANLGVFVAADWLSLLVFFEVLGFVGLLFVVHRGDAPSRRAGLKYFWLTLLGGVALLGGIAVLHQTAGSVAFAPFPDTAAARWAAALMLIGFGVKAGMLGVHVWLPDAHSVAPAPASALLSGVMIKAGAFGVFRCLGELTVPEMASSFGAAVVGLGLAGMLVGAVAALAQRQAKRLLAWSSISQMGFILAALGAGAVLGTEGADARAAGLMHAFNHALFKGALFLAVGALVHAAGTGDLDRLGGAARRTPLMAVAMLVAVGGIVGVPGFNGFASKTLVHHALAALGAHDARFASAEWIYYAASVGTAAMFARLAHCLFLAHPRSDRLEPLPATLPAATWLPAVAIVVVGLRPTAAFEFAIAPAVPAAHAPHPGTADAVAAVLVLLAGIGTAWLAHVVGLADRRLPEPLTVDGAYRRAAAGASTACEVIARNSARARVFVIDGLAAAIGALRRGLALRWIDSERVAARGAALRLPHDRLYRHLDEQRDRIVECALEMAERRVGPGDPPRRERMLDATRHYAGWLATRLINAGLRLELDRGLAMADSSECRDRLAGFAVEMAVADVESGHERRALALADEAMDGLLGPHREAPEPPMPYRHWLHEIRSILFHLLTDPARRHWPASESLAHGALSSKLRARLRRLAHDPGAGLALAAAVLLCVFALSRWAN